MSVRARLRRWLDRGHWRWVLAPLATAELIRVHRKPCLVTPSLGWIHRYPSGTIEHGSVGMPPLPIIERNTFNFFLYRYTPKPGDVVVDIGAGAGEEVWTFSRLVGGSGRVVAVEAHPTTVEILRRNVRRWGLTNVTIVHAALAGAAGSRRLADDGASESNRLVLEGGVEVPAITFDQLLDTTGVQQVDLLKMNIEGAEREVLGGATRLHAVSNAAVECHDFLADAGADPSFATSAEVERTFRAAGFDVTRHPPDDRRPWARYYIYASR